MNVGVDVLYWMDECLLNKAPHNDVLGEKEKKKEKKDIEMEKQAKANKRKTQRNPKILPALDGCHARIQLESACRLNDNGRAIHFRRSVPKKIADLTFQYSSVSAGASGS